MPGETEDPFWEATIELIAMADAFYASSPNSDG